MNPVRRWLFVFLISSIIPACGGGANSKGAAAPPSAPTTLVATVQTSARIDLTWIDTATNEFEFRIERASALAGPYTQIATVPMNSQGYSDLGLQAGTAYFYQVAAWNGKGLSAFAGPATDTTAGLTWVPESVTGAPAMARASHSAIYDAIGTRMIVYGGLDDGLTVYNDLYAFDLSTLAISATPWSAPAVSGITPPFRYAHSAIYDSAQRRMIVFGGQDDGFVNRNEVFALDLATLTWSQPAVTGTPPTARSFHTAVYDGANQQMIVHGGNDGAFELADAHLLSLPAAPPFAWSSPPVGARPAGRSQHVSVYDPIRSRQVTFGGLDNETIVDGSVLNNESWTLTPGASLSWTQLFFGGTPTFRMGHSAVYDAANQRMVIFGGDTTTMPTMTDEMWGLRLDVTPVWSILTPTAGAPPAGRMGHSAIYDSAFKRMIVYGGNDATATAFNEVWSIGF